MKGGRGEGRGVKVRRREGREAGRRKWGGRLWGEEGGKGRVARQRKVRGRRKQGKGEGQVLRGIMQSAGDGVLVGVRDA